ncbi:MAG TPA: type VII secretion protein EccB, partial [Nocardioides sp.]
KLRANVLDVAVQPGYGAYVNVGQHGAATAGTPVVIDMDAKRYRLGGPKGETAELLGFGSVKAPTVPDAWTESFDCGPELSQEAARRQPTAKAMKTCG